ncbi:MAG: LamG domain-containing protein, partial [Minisyncoccia bacterium]
RFFTGSNGANERMRILGNGNIGIGTTTPQARLDVAGGVRIGDDTSACTSSNVGTLRYSNLDLQVCTNSGWFSSKPTPTIVQDGLVLHLDAGNPASYTGTGTTWTDLSGNNNNGTLVNGPTYNSANGGSLVVDGVDDYIITTRLSNTGNSNSSQSYCLWVKPDDTNGNILSMSSSNPQGSWNMPPIAASSSRFRGKFWSNQYLNATSTYVNSQWYYVCLIFSYNSVTANAYQRLYVNGDLNSEQTNITYSASGSNNFLFFGQQNPGADNAGMFKGSYGSIQIYTNKALTAEEVQQNFNATKGRFGL